MSDEALLILRSDDGWQATAAYRTGSADSALAVDVGNTSEYLSVPEHLRSASWPVSRPCVTLQTSNLCILDRPEQVRGLAQWLVAASIALEQAAKDYEDA